VGDLCEGRVVVVTGAGGGIGRCHALALAREGARVVVNDRGGAADGSGASDGPATAVVEEIRAAGGQAVANTGDVSSAEGAEQLVGQAIETYGRLDVLVNNAGILRDRMLVSMREADWDDVIRVHLRGTFLPSRAAGRHWRERSKRGEQPDGRLITTTSPSGLFGNVGQTNYAAAKAGIAAFTVIAAQELARYGVTVNAIAPTALTRLTALPGVEALDEATKRGMAPEHVSPLVVWLAGSRSAGITGQVFGVWGSRISVAEGWCYGPSISRPDESLWPPEDLGDVVPELVARAAGSADIMGRRTPAPTLEQVR
jgi:NAD(P)-dependent dehydrogenase (short-subunit alcohol dehydrogenase family)